MKNIMFVESLFFRYLKKYNDLPHFNSLNGYIYAAEKYDDYS